MRTMKIGSLCLGLLCAAGLACASGCGDKAASDAKTAQQTQDFRGHQPTPEQLQAAMSKMAPHSPAPGPPNSAK